MNSIHLHTEEQIPCLNKRYSVILLTDPGQAEKTTMPLYLAKKENILP